MKQLPGSRLIGVLLLALAAVSQADTPVPVGVTTARMAVINEEVALHGSFVARRVSRLSSEIDGLVSEIHVDDGDVLSAGTEVVRLDQRFAAIARDAAVARLAEARARHAEAERRHRELAELQQSKHIAETTVASARAQIDIDAALVKQAEAELERSRELHARHLVHALFDAVVQRKLVERGEWVETSTALVELVDISVLRLEVPVPQFYFAAVDERTEVDIHLDALPDQPLRARVTRKIPIGDPASRTFRVRIDVPNPERALAPGMSARVVFSLGAAAQAPSLVLPRDAVVRKPDGSQSVWAIETADGVTTAVPREVRTGRAYREYIEIVTGDIAAGDRIVVRGNEILRPGQAVRVAEQRDAVADNSEPATVR